MGQLVEHVEAKGLAENTLFVFVSDNGWRPSENRERSRPEEFAHTARSKRAPFDDGLRSPILIRWDGVTRPATHDGLVSSIDLMPTLLAAAGVDPDAIARLPGLNLLPVARGESRIAPNRAIFGEIYPGDASRLGHPERDVAYRWVRQGNMKLIVPHAPTKEDKPWGGYLERIALFDVATDPFEAENLATLPSQQRNVIRLQERLDHWWTPAP
ncbi:MAG: sulfatase-like hydrolase/transferase [Planctomycetes bacterium]|nr:sulfatase-like hydrolase/transferase [Planctomycetota bacterium]